MGKTASFKWYALKSLFFVFGALLDGCSDYAKPLPNGYELNRTNASTILIFTPEEDYPREIIVPPKIVSWGRVKDVVFGEVVDSPNSSVSEDSVPGYFILYTQNGVVLLGLSEEEWLKELKNLGIEEPKVKHTG